MKLRFALVFSCLAGLAGAQALPSPAPPQIAFPGQYAAAPPEWKYAVWPGGCGRYQGAEKAECLEFIAFDFGRLSRFAAANAALAPAKPGETRVVFFGDSITDNWSKAGYGGFFPGKPYLNRGIGGQTTSQMLLRFRADVVALKPAAVVILAGTNDVAGNSGPVTVEQLQDNLASMAELASAHRIKVVLASILPVADDKKDAQDRPLIRTQGRPPVTLKRMNQWMAAYAKTNGHTYLDYAASLADAAGLLKPELNGDGLHPNAAGYALMAPLAEKAIASALRSASPRAPSVALSGTFEKKALVRVMSVAADWQLANPSEHEPYQWHVAPFWAGLVAFAPLSATPQRYLDAVRANADKNEWKPGPRPFHADDHAITQSYFLLHRKDKDPKQIAAALALFDEMLAKPFDEPLEFSGEKTSREWVWCDALFMSPPALALAAQATGKHAYLDMMNRLWWKTSDYLYDKDEQLYYRDSRFFPQREPNGKKVFWSRGNGWVLAGLARVLEYMPANDPLRPRFLAQYKEMAQKIAGLQGKDGYWSASLLDPASRPMPESSGSGFFTYAFAWGIRNGVLDRATYEPAVHKGWSALVRAVQPSGMLGYVQRVGDSPGDTAADKTEIYGVGALLLAGSEIHQLAKR